MGQRTDKLSSSLLKADTRGIYREAINRAQVGLQAVGESSGRVLYRVAIEFPRLTVDAAASTAPLSGSGSVTLDITGPSADSAFAGRGIARRALTNTPCSTPLRAGWRDPVLLHRAVHRHRQHPEPIGRLKQTRNKTPGISPAFLRTSASSSVSNSASPGLALRSALLGGRPVSAWW